MYIGIPEGVQAIFGPPSSGHSANTVARAQISG